MAKMFWFSTTGNVVRFPSCQHPFFEIMATLACVCPPDCIYVCVAFLLALSTSHTVGIMNLMAGCSHHFKLWQRNPRKKLQRTRGFEFPTFDLILIDLICCYFSPSLPGQLLQSYVGLLSWHGRPLTLSFRLGKSSLSLDFFPLSFSPAYSKRNSVEIPSIQSRVHSNNGNNSREG